MIFAAASSAARSAGVRAGNSCLRALLVILDGGKKRVFAESAALYRSPVHKSADWIFRRSPAEISAVLCRRYLGLHGIRIQRGGFGDDSCGRSDMTALAFVVPRSAGVCARGSWFSADGAALGKSRAIPAPGRSGIEQKREHQRRATESHRVAAESPADSAATLAHGGGGEDGG